MVAVGPGSPRAPVGTRVLHSGGHATLAVAPVDKLLAHPLPDDLSIEDAIFARLAGISFTALQVATVDTGATVVVVGLGMIGNLAAQLFRIAGCRVLAVDPNPRRREIARACGLVETLERLDHVREVTNGRGAEIVVDATGLPDVVAGCVDHVARFGELVLLGTPRGQPRQPVDFTHFVSRAHELSLRIVGAHGTTSPWREGTAVSRTPVRRSWEKKVRLLWQWMRPGPGAGEPPLRVAPLRTHVLPPEAASQAYSGLLDSSDAYMGVLFRWDGGAG